MSLLGKLAIVAIAAFDAHRFVVGTKRFVLTCNAIAAAGRKPTVPEVLPLVREFYAMPDNGAGGHLHCVLDDGNFDDYFVESALVNALLDGDDAAQALCSVIALMSKTQRKKLARLKR